MRITSCLLIWLIWQPSVFSQVNVLGKPGHIMTPSAAWNTEKHFGVGFAYVPPPYAVNNFMGSVDHVQNYYAFRVGLTDFLEVNLNLTRIPAMRDKIGVGDRHLDIRIRLLEEKQKWPALAVVISPPGSLAPHLSQNVLVASKNFKTAGEGRFQLTAGYGLPYYLRRAPKRQREGPIWNQFDLQPKSTRGNHYLNGFFGAVLWHPWEFLGLMVEHDSRNFNAGAVVHLNTWLLLQGYTFEGRKLGFTVSMHFPLDFAPYELRKHAK